MQTSTEKEYRDGRKRSGVADWSHGSATATHGPCRLPARRFLLTSVIRQLFALLRFGRATASPRWSRHMPSETGMDHCGLHAYFEAQAAASSAATWGSAKPTTNPRCGNPWADTQKTGTLCVRPTSYPRVQSSLRNNEEQHRMLAH